jgi:hypothetical protein
LTVLPAPSIAATAESVSITQVLGMPTLGFNNDGLTNQMIEQVKDSSFEGAQAFFSRVAKDLTELKHYLREMKSIWVHLHQQVTTMAEKAPVEDLEVACKKIQVFYQDYSSRVCCFLSRSRPTFDFFIDQKLG